MPKQGQRAEVNTFVQGLITEASPLNFPPNASREEENFELFRDGTRKRRKGMDLEEGYVYKQCPNFGQPVPPTPKFNSFIWESAAGVVGQDFLAIQNGNDIDLYDLRKTPLTPAGPTGGYLSTVTLATGNEQYSFASIEGCLVVATGTARTYLIKFNGLDVPFTPSFTQEIISLKVRDFWGIDTNNVNLETDIYFRPATLTEEHAYNLENQSWGIARKNDAGTMTNPIALYFSTYSKYPSNSEVVWTGLQFQAVNGATTPYERIFANLYEETLGLQAPAAKGFFVIDALSRGQSRNAAFQRAYTNSGNLMYTTLTPPDDITPGGPTVVAAFAGRAWYGGFSGLVTDGDDRSPSLNSYLLFSQLVRNTLDLSKCYQEGDPTSREGSDVVDTDGGFVKITGMGKLIGLLPMGPDLIALADNGVWTVTGGSDFGFTATNYKVSQLSAYGCSAPNSVVVQGEAIFYWGDGGIYSIGRDRTLGTLVVNNITKTTIQTLYNEIPLSALPTVSGVYDDALKKIKWIYNVGEFFTESSKSYELTLDIDIGNFCLNRIYNTLSFNIEVILPFFYEDKTHYLVYKKTGGSFNQYTFAEYRDEEFLDWKSVDGVGIDAKAFLLTGAQIAGDSAVYKQAPYLVMHFTRTETGTDATATPLNQSSCLFRTVWDWSKNDTISNKVGQFQQAYRYRKALVAIPNSTYDNGFEVVTSKNKVRGRGRSLALYMETEPKKECHILGWNITLNGNSVA